MLCGAFEAADDAKAHSRYTAGISAGNRGEIRPRDGFFSRKGEGGAANEKNRGPPRSRGSSRKGFRDQTVICLAMTMG